MKIERQGMNIENRMDNGDQFNNSQNFSQNSSQIPQFQQQQQQQHQHQQQQQQQQHPHPGQHGHQQHSSGGVPIFRNQHQQQHMISPLSVASSAPTLHPNYPPSFGQHYSQTNQSQRVQPQSIHNSMRMGPTLSRPANQFPQQHFGGQHTSSDQDAEQANINGTCREIADLLATDPELLDPTDQINRESSPTSVLDNGNPMHRTSSFNSRISNPRSVEMFTSNNDPINEMEF
jgi:hypothetical protein